MPNRIPIMVLGGSDSKPGPVPEAFDNSQMLRGCKGAIALPGGGCLAQELVNRIRGSRRFEEPTLFGPESVYRSLVDCRVVDVDGDLAETLRAVHNEVLSLPDPTQPVAFIACDILPAANEFQQLMDTSYQPHAQSNLWGQLVAVDPTEMGASSWKPAYSFPHEPGADPQTMYPGHLVIARPAALRMRLLNHLLQLTYRHRNLRLLSRPIPMIAKGLGQLIKEDCRNLLRGQMPVLSLSIPWQCLTALIQFHRGQLSVSEFSQTVMKVFVHRDFHGSAPPPVVFSTTSITAFARDLDTKDELAELTRSLSDASATVNMPM